MTFVDGQKFILPRSLIRVSSSIYLCIYLLHPFSLYICISLSLSPRLKAYIVRTGKQERIRARSRGARLRISREYIIATSSYAKCVLPSRSCYIHRFQQTRVLATIYILSSVRVSRFSCDGASPKATRAARDWPKTPGLNLVYTS